MKTEFIKWDAGDNLHCLIDGEKYVFAFSEWYGGTSCYGICFPGDNFFSKFNRSKKATHLYSMVKSEIDTLIKNNPHVTAE